VPELKASLRLGGAVVRLEHAMTRFDRTWEPLLVLLVALALLIGTRC